MRITGNQRRAGWSALWCTAVGMVALAFMPENQPLRTTAPRPFNVLFIAVDDLRPELGCYGAQQMHTPNIDALAAQGVLFERAYAQQAWCSPSRTSLLTGLRPDSTRVYDLETHFRSTRPGVVTLPQHFKLAGYQVVGLGKVFHETLDDSLSWSVSTWRPPVSDPLRHYVLPENVSYAATHKGYATATEQAEVSDTVYADGKLTERAVTLLGQLKDQPFFMAVGFHKPHLPFNAPARYWRMYDRKAISLPSNQQPKGAPAYAFMSRAEHHNYRDIPAILNGTPLPDSVTLRLAHGYYASVSFIDAQVGRLLDALKNNNLADNTIVVLWGDHGWKLGEYASWSKHTNYEIDTRVPLLIRSPTRAKAGLRVRSLVELLDVYPTIAELANLPAPRQAQGISLVPLMAGQKIRPKTAAFSQFIRNDSRTHTTYRDATIIGHAIRTDRYRLVRWVEKKKPERVLALELYDHQTDPAETINQVYDPSMAKVVTQLTGQLQRHFKPERNSP